MTERIILDGEKLLQRREAHTYLKEKLGFPEYYGRNLDALSDCLSEFSGEIALTEVRLLRETEGYGRRILGVFLDSAEKNPNLFLEISE